MIDRSGQRERKISNKVNKKNDELTKKEPNDKGKEKI